MGGAEQADADVFFPDDPDWTWQYPWQRRLPDPSTLDLALEALRRAVELRDTALEAGDESDTPRKAHLIVSVLNPLFYRLLAEAVSATEEEVRGYRGSAFEQVAELRRQGLLPPRPRG